MPIKRASEKAKSNHVFGQRRKQSKMFRAGLYARVSTNDQQTLPVQMHALREYAGRRGWTVAVQVREVGSGAMRREAREQLLDAARRREVDVVLVWRLDRWGRSVTDLLATLLHAKDHHARAAAVRVAGLWQDRLPNPSELLAPLVADEHPQVRMEAVRALARVPSPRSTT